MNLFCILKLRVGQLVCLCSLNLSFGLVVSEFVLYSEVGGRSVGLLVIWIIHSGWRYEC